MPSATCNPACSRPIPYRVFKMELVTVSLLYFQSVWRLKCFLTRHLAFILNPIPYPAKLILDHNSVTSWKNLEMVKQKKCSSITQSGKNYAINCAIQGVRLIWKQRIWLAICEFLWSLTNQNAWFVTSFCTELTLFYPVFKKNKTALLLTNQNGEKVLLYIISAWIL